MISILVWGLPGIIIAAVEMGTVISSKIVGKER